MKLHVDWPNKYNFLMKTFHGPQRWPFWKIVSISIVRCSGVIPPSIGYNLWIYTRWGALLISMFLDRRKNG